MKIILIVGPSGSGKDTLLRHARKNLQLQNGIQFCRRYITRPPDNNEDNYFIDPFAFSHLKDTGFFLTSWQAHENNYGIAGHLFTNGLNKQTMICSVSRTVIGDFENTDIETTTILVTADQRVLRNRLQNRAREHDDAIEKRLARAHMNFHANNLITFDNSSNLRKSISDFTSLIAQLANLTPSLLEVSP